MGSTKLTADKQFEALMVIINGNKGFKH